MLSTLRVCGYVCFRPTARTVKTMSAPEAVARHGAPRRATSSAKPTATSLIAEEFSYLVQRERNRRAKSRLALARVMTCF